MEDDVGQNVLATLLVIWRDLLQTSEIGQEDDFIALGGDSLLAMEMTFRVHEAFGLPPPEEAILGIDEGSTLADLCRYIFERTVRQPGL